MEHIEANLEEIKTGTLNVLKCRDDHEPIFFREIDDSGFKLTPASTCSWIKDDESFGPNKLRKQIEPWLTALAQSEHFSLLIGSGLSEAVHRISTVTKDTPDGKGMPGMGPVEWKPFKSQIKVAAETSAKSAGRDNPNFEDQIRVVNEMLKGLQHYCADSAILKKHKELKDEIKELSTERIEVLKNFSEGILKAEKNIATTEDKKREVAFGYLVNFLLSFASRSGTRDRLQIFTTNYDRIIEAGAEISGLHLIDRFVGNLFPIFRSSRLNIDMHYNPPGIRGEPRYLEGVAHFVKLHGSLDWIYSGNEIRRMGLPFGAASIDTYLNVIGLDGIGAGSLIIYPNEAKDRETSEYPYVELFRDFAAAVCRPNHTLVTYGYGFGDEHINRMIEDMLTIPSTHLVIISYSDPLGRIMKTYDKVCRPAQTTLMIGNNLGDLKTLVDYYLPKPAIDRTTFKMAELLKARLGTEHTEKDDGITPSGGEE
jgi:hypothetical protein